jgi:pyruvate/2-oxoglutarate/acetoin dehydrogenase E1 component
MRKINMFRAINEAFVEEMTRDETVIIVGESIQGGSMGTTNGLVQRFGPSRVFDTPLSEHAIAGMAIGAALAGYRPVADMMMSELIYTCSDEVLVAAPEWRFIHGGNQKVPLVYFALTTSYVGIGPDHSKHPSATVLHNPGLKLVVPSSPYDAKGLMKTAIRDNNPVCYFLSSQLSGVSGEVPDGEYTIPFGVADIKRKGKDVTVVATSYMVKLALDVAKELEGKIDVEVVDPRTLEPLDIDTIVASVKKTGRAVIVDEDTKRCGVGAEIGMQIVERAFDFLDAPVQRIGAANYPIPAAAMEKCVLPQAADIMAAIKTVTGKN